MFLLFFSSVLLAIRAILQSPMRAALTVFGILIGVAAVVITVALGEGAEAAVQKNLASLGDNVVSVGPELSRASGSLEEAAVPRLTEGDATALLRESPSVSMVSAYLNSIEDVTIGGNRQSIAVIGTTRQFFDIRVWPMASGTLWSEQAEITASRVCVLGAAAALELFGKSDPVGQMIRIGRHPFRILGVLAIRNGSDTPDERQDLLVKMPLSTKRAKLQPAGPGVVDRILVKARSDDSFDAARQDISAILRQRHSLREGDPDDFWVRNDQTFRDVQAKIVSVLSALLTSIAAISLLVGGIGIMNILLVSVTERTREIGLRMAIGATRPQILLQFLTESVLLSLIGGALGAAVAVVGTGAVGKAISLPLEPSGSALLVALGVSTGVGLVFGLLPSWRAASLDPIVALGRQ